MKKTLCLLLSVLMILGLAACGSEKQEPVAEEEGFKPALDTSTSCNINVAGGYDNFEALEVEFDRFNKYYPDVELTTMPRTCPIPRWVLILTASAATSF